MYYSLKDDYSEGCHPLILEKLQESNFSQQEGYGDDEYSQKAKELIRSEIGVKDAIIHFVTGGTQANLLVISSMLKPYESVIAADSGHINTHEAGAIEATGHKVCAIDSADGKLTPALIGEVLSAHQDPPHMVKPKLVYISNATEVGSVYSKQELEELYSFCKKNGLLLYMDGARLGSALASSQNGLSMRDIARSTDAFYIGGTKNGALLGEAIVLGNTVGNREFAYNIKQKGALLAKGRLLGVQFQALFEDGLFYSLAKHANSMAESLAEGIEKAGYAISVPPESNQIFPILPTKLVKKLQKKYDFYIWRELGNGKTIIRLVCSWATKKEVVTQFINDCSVL